MAHSLSFLFKIKQYTVTKKRHGNTEQVQQLDNSQLSNLKAKIKGFTTFLSYVKETYYNKPFLAVYLPTRVTYDSIWMLAPGGLYIFQQLGFDPIGIQAITAIASSISAALAPINGLLTDKFSALLSIIGVVEASCDYNYSINNHYLVMHILEIRVNTNRFQHSLAFNTHCKRITAALQKQQEPQLPRTIRSLINYYLDMQDLMKPLKRGFGFRILEVNSGWN
jgi:hypothetical protein